MKKIRAPLRWLLALIIGSVIGNLSSPITNAVMLNLWLTVKNGLQWLQVWFRVISDAYQSGYVRGVVFNTSEGQWAVGWYLGGPPFIHTVILLVFLGISLSSVLALLIYLTCMHHKYIRFKRCCTVPRHPRNFGETVSFLLIASLIAMSFIGIAGTMVNPKLLVPAEPSPDALEERIGVSDFLEITVVRHILLDVHPSIIDANDLDGEFCCIVKIPVNSTWHLDEIESLAISLNGKAIAHTLANNFADSHTRLELRLEKRLLKSLLQENGMQGRIVILEVDGRLRNEDFFAGNTQIILLYSRRGGMARFGMVD